MDHSAVVILIRYAKRTLMQ